MKKVVLRSGVKKSDTWDLELLYSSPEDWLKDFSAIEKTAQTISNFQGKLDEGVEVILNTIETYMLISRKLERLYTYAHLLSDGDTAETTAQGYLDRAVNLYSRFSAWSSYLTPELLSLSEQQIEEILNSALLKPYRRFLLDIIRYKPHTLSAQEEQLLASASEIHQASSKAFSQLNNADLTFEPVVIEGIEHPLTHGTYQVFLKNAAAEIRKQAFEKYYRQFDAHKNTISSLLSSSIKKNVFVAHSRKHKSALAQSLFQDDVSEDVYSCLIDTVSKNLAPLHRYYDLRKLRLGIKEQHVYDTYVPVVKDINLNTTYEEASEMILDAVAILGDEYVEILRRGFLTERWVDRYENKGKRSGAYSSGCYDSAPYMLMNYKDDHLQDVFTLAHEAGHSMHTYHSNKNQSYQDHSYTIFVAEVASTCHEQLLFHFLCKKYANQPDVMAYLINEQIDDIKGTFYRQTMFAEFERETHRLCEKNEPLTVDVFRGIYRKLLEKYFGQAVIVSDIDELECLRIPHFYSAFYVYKYATGISAALRLSEGILAGDKDAIKRYLDFLKGGCSKFPLELLSDAGVDLRTPAAFENTARVFDGLLSRLESC